jgi:hypothetical protein
MSGTLFYISEPARYAGNTAFRIKMLLVMLAGLNALWFRYRFRRVTGAALDEPPGELRAIGAASLAIWLCVLVLGRLLPYFGPTD